MTPARRSLLAADWLIREHAQAWLRLAGLTYHADALAALPEITGNDGDDWPARRSVMAARRDALAAEQAASKRPGATAAWSGLKAVQDAGIAAWDAIQPGRASIVVAAWDTARNAAWAAAFAGHDCEPTKAALAASWARLAARMHTETEEKP